MTQKELDELPEAKVFCLGQPDDEPAMVTDLSGQSWLIGYAYGKRWKMKMESGL